MRALELDPNLAEAHNALGLALLIYDWDRASAQNQFQRALDLNPGYATGHHYYGHHLAWSARFTEAFAELELAQELDPLSLAIRTNIGWLTGLSRRFGAAIEKLRFVLSMDSRFVRAHLYLGTLLGQVEKYPEGLSELQRVRELSGEGASVISTEAWLYARSGDMQRASASKEKLLALAQQTYVSPPEILMVCVAMRQKEEAIRWLAEAVKQRAPTLVWAGLDFRLDEMRRDPQFLGLLPKSV
jgi:Flp pilus assembly protein TadD